MTKVTLHYDLSRPLTGEDFDNLGNVHSTFGMVRVKVDASGKSLTVDYDASRLMRKDVEAVLQRHGIPIQTVVSA
jgi:hypothetical protein